MTQAKVNSYAKGQRVRLSVVFTDDQQAPVDPDASVIVKYKDPAGAVTTKTYLTDQEVVRDGTGAYHIDVDPNQAGTWDYRWEGSGANTVAAAEGSFLTVSNF